ncbi:uncharacterized protein PFL1_03393 [Pseudozyma flocculosa PF-1]|uniref:UBC core domain-containing protein n=2 Tax=Pseudozyma flocculosa TaxID=84751 RepID=A0A5C3F6M4_9BASI|nr:uncharacterized protein PFL1_03393 [Pseudozyma flocculosa PF-1]EPQ29104.1 hypothetical protein PFL1_03393 [Pseudozyma flocculosa PF-1]SPO40098.1 uncharacterized protein PSFLO_05580 [Pseudozyma flocculosa]
MSQPQTSSQPSKASSTSAHPAPATASAAAAGRRIFHEDVVRRIGSDGSSRSGVVLRCWQRDEPETQDTLKDQTGKNRALKQGEIGVFWSPSDAREIINEEEVEVIDRALHVGDVCKRSHRDKASCVVVDVKRNLTLEHVISKKRIDHEVPSDDVQNAVRVTRGDYVIVDDWVGLVEDVFEEALLETSDSTELQRVFDVGISLPVGKVHPEVYQDSYFVWESQFRSGRLPDEMTILDVRQTVLCVNWLAMNQTLTPEEQERRPRPKRFWTTDIDRLTLVRSFADYCQAVGDRVVFRNADLARRHGVEPTFHGPDSLPVEVCHVVHTSTKVQVVWQDGTRTEEDARCLLPYVNIDEYEVWPGDWVWWQPSEGGGDGTQEQVRKPAIVQSMDPEERTAEIRIYGTDAVETVPVLELNVHGTDPDTFGIHRGDVIMLDSKPHGMPLPALPRVGQSEEIPDLPQLNEQLSRRGLDLSSKHPVRTPLSAPRDPKRDAAAAASIDWYGSVTELRLDGGIVVSLPGGREIVTQLEKVSLLGEGFADEDEDELYDDYEDDLADDAAYYGERRKRHAHGEHGDGADDDEDAMWMDEEGHEVTSRDEWEDVDAGDVTGNTVFEDAVTELPGSESASAAEVTDVVEIVVDAEQDPAERQRKPVPPEKQEPEGQLQTPLPSTTEVDTPMDEVKAASAAGPGASRSQAQRSTEPPQPTASEPEQPQTQEQKCARCLEKPPSDSVLGDESLSAGMPTDDPRWSRFEILEEAPSDHAFLKEPAGSTSSAAYFKRIQREFKVLQSSLPDSILVRSYEDRTDLLRVLIIGSEGTPYEDAPFVIDFHLKPTFPQEPPVAHFHSWTNGGGRVSPNLYEEGKVCLSVLGTWSGQESESWSPTQSSLLQVFVSIQGLVLVREPWFTEPAYEKLKGTEEGEVNSALYSEKAFVLARGFVRRALEQPPQGLRDELEFLYYGADSRGEGEPAVRGRLEKVMQRCRDLIAEAEEAKRRRAAQRNGGGSEDQTAQVAEGTTNRGHDDGAGASTPTKVKGQSDDAISHISMGSCIVLQRHLAVLERLWRERQAA